MLNAYDMLKIDEGLRYKAYKDTVGKTTVGIGFNMDSSSAKGVWLHSDIPESFNMVYTGQLALSTNSVVKLFNTCLDSCRIDLESIFSDFETYPEYIQLALTNLMFNLGKTKFLKFDTFINLITENKYENASLDLFNTLWAKQLVKRANRVCRLINGDFSAYS